MATIATTNVPIAMMLKAGSAARSRQRARGATGREPPAAGSRRDARVDAAGVEIVSVMASSPKGRLSGTLGDPVEGQQQDEIDQGVEQADGRRVTELGLLQADLVDVGLYDLGHRQVEVGLHE